MRTEDPWYVRDRTSPLQDAELSEEGFGSCLAHQRVEQVGGREVF